jgi:cell division protease FtsH
MTENKQNTNNNTGNTNRKKNFKDIPPLKPGKSKFNPYWIYGILAIVFIGIQIMGTDSALPVIDWYKFEDTMLKQHDVSKIVVVNGKYAEIYIKKDRLKDEKYKTAANKNSNTLIGQGPQYKLPILDVKIFSDKLDQAQKDFSREERVPVIPEDRKDVFGELLSWILPLIILFAIWMFFMRKMTGGGSGGQIFSIGKSKAKVFDKGGEIKVSFKDVAGLEEAKIEIQEIVEFLKNPGKYRKLGGKIPKGALLVGPPGTGKTLLAKAVAGEAHVPFFSLSGSDFVEMFVGVGASRVRDLFKQAKEKSPCIVFIDEIDAIGRARGKNPNMGANDERENTLNQLLTEMDGFGDNSGVIILAATNRADILDKALLRAGRFDRQIHVELPDVNERKEIFEVHLKPLKYNAKEIDVDFLAKQTPGFSGADIANVCNEAALIAARKNHNLVTKQDFLDAVDRIIGGLEKKNKITTKEEKKTIAYHEAGHATASWFLKYANPLVKVTIIPRGKALGAAWYLPEERQITTQEQMLDEMCATLAGRASEEINFGKISSGALNDLEKVTKTAYAMITYYGMSDKLGNISYFDSTGQNEYGFTKPYSEKTAELIDQEVSKLINEQYKRALQILQEHKEGLIKLGEVLLEREVIFAEDLEKIFGKRPWGSRADDLQKEIDSDNNKHTETIQ